MTDETPADHRVARMDVSHLVVLAIVGAVFFAGGYCASLLSSEGRVREQSEARFRKFLTIGIDLGIIAVDQDRLEEIACIASESDDDDAAGRGEGGVR